MAVPEFILRKLIVPDSLNPSADGFIFRLCNTFAPGTLHHIAIQADGKTIPPHDVTFELENQTFKAADIDPQHPFKIPFGAVITVRIHGFPLPVQLGMTLTTVEIGEVSFTYNTRQKKKAALKLPRLKLPGGLRPALTASADLNIEDVIGEISPRVYGQFIEHLERCIYDGIWNPDGTALREDTYQLIHALKPPVIRYPGGNFASGYHWEDGIGPRDQRPKRFDQAWNAWESNQVGTDEFMAFVRRLGTEAYITVNDGSGTPDEAARWVAYCNEPASSAQGKRRAKNGTLEPYCIRLWGVGNEVWGAWQIGTTSADKYAQRLRAFIAEMRAVDPTIENIAVGDTVLSDAPDDRGRLWNQAVLQTCAEEIDLLSFHVYQPDQSGWLETYDPDELHKTVTAAPLDVEEMIQRMAAQIQAHQKTRPIKIALDEWNLWLTPPPQAASMHQVVYTMRDALYCAGMLNVFHRQCQSLGMANLAQLVNVLPLIVTDSTRAAATSMYYPFLLYRSMQPLALRVRVESPVFACQGLGENITARSGVPVLDMTATRSIDGSRLTIGLINRSPDQKVKVTVRLTGAQDLQPVRARQMTAPTPQSANTLDAPDQCKISPAQMPGWKYPEASGILPACSITTWEFERD